MLASIQTAFTSIFSEINDFLNQNPNFLNVISVSVSVITLITMLRFKHRIRVESEKETFRRKKNRIVKDIDGFSGSLLGNAESFYVPKFLEMIDLYLLELIASYTFLNPWLTVKLRCTSFCINHFYMNEAASGNCKSRHKLCRQLRGILALMRKE